MCGGQRGEGQIRLVTDQDEEILAIADSFAEDPTLADPQPRVQIGPSHRRRALHDGPSDDRPLRRAIRRRRRGLISRAAARGTSGSRCRRLLRRGVLAAAAGWGALNGGVAGFAGIGSGTRVLCVPAPGISQPRKAVAPLRHPVPVAPEARRSAARARRPG